MVNYYDYFEEKPHIPGTTTMDEFIAEAMRTDLKFRNPDEELHYQKTSRITLKNEVLTCYEFLRRAGLLYEYKLYRDGEDPDELPFNED